MASVGKFSLMFREVYLANPSTNEVFEEPKLDTNLMHPLFYWSFFEPNLSTVVRRTGNHGESQISGEASAAVG